MSHTRRRPARRRRGLTRWELAIAVLLAMATWRILEPPVRVFILRSRRAEAGLILESLVQHGLDHPVSAGPFPRDPAAVDAGRVQLTGGPDGWTPPVRLARCAYTTAGTSATATCDVDGDGVPSRFSARPGGFITRETPEGVY